MKLRLLIVALLAAAAAGCGTVQTGDAVRPESMGGGPSNAAFGADDDVWGDEGGAFKPISDPFQPVNRAFFHFNDKMYFWVLRPAATGYGYVIPRPARVGLRNFFSNLGVIGRFFNCTMQGDFKGTGTELARFGINTTVGVLGFGDPALHWFGIKIRNEDFGQTLGVYGMGPGAYFDWPLIGSSCVRDTIGLIPDALMSPLTFLPGANLLERINDRSLGSWGYEELTGNALDPYVAVRNAYDQRRLYLINEDRR